MQDHPGAPGTARQESTRTIVSTNDGGTATQPRAPGHDRPFTASADAAKHGRLSAASTAPGADVPLVSLAGAPGQHHLSAVAIATVALPAGPHRLRQEDLPRTPANPRTLTHSPAHQHSTRNRLTVVQALPSPCTAGGLQGDQPTLLPLSNIWRGGWGVRPSAHPTTHQVQPAIQVPPYSRACSTATTGFIRQHPSRAPPAPPPSLRLSPQSSRTSE